MNIAIIYKGMNLLRIVENWAAPYVLVMTAILLAWIVYQAGGIGFRCTSPVSSIASVSSGRYLFRH